MLRKALIISLFKQESWVSMYRFMDADPLVTIINENPLFTLEKGGSISAVLTDIN
jgi:hypothetical protein